MTLPLALNVVMVKSPSVSVLMPCFNPGPFLSEAVASVLNQPDCLELLVADGGSTDGSLEFLSELAFHDSRLRIVSRHDRGPADALNLAFAHARGTLIGWLNADDLYPSGALSRAVAALAAHPCWLMVYGEGEEFHAGTGLRQRYPTLQPRVGLDGFRSHCFICQPTVVFRRTMALLLGPFDLQWRTAFDFDYWLRAFAAFPDRIGYLPTLQGLTRLHSTTITSTQRDRVALEATALLARHFGVAARSRLHCYALELQLGIARRPPDCSLHEHLAQVFGQAQPWLSSAEYQALLQDWLLDGSAAPLQIAAEAAASSRNLAADRPVQLLQIVQPHLRLDQAGPPAGPYLRLSAAVADASVHVPLLRPEAHLPQPLNKGSTHAPFGVNLICSAEPDLHTAIWLQGLQAMFRCAQVPLAVARTATEPGPYAINLIALPPPLHAQWLLNHGVGSHSDRLAIAAWPWIGSQWPLHWQPLLEFVDEIWAPSGMVEEALRGVSIPSLWRLPSLPPQPVPRQATLASSPHAPRVVLSADLREPTPLLNTFGAVELFCRAFPPLPLDATTRVQSVPHLHLLVEYPHASPSEWQWLQACCAHDFRIHIHVLDELSLKQRLSLVAEADVLLALQRSFALPSLLNTAQSMGLSVIASATGAALDLPVSSNLHLVPVRQVPIGRDVYPGVDSLYWGEPDSDAATAVLQASMASSPLPYVYDCEQEMLRAARVMRDRLLRLWKQRWPD